MRKRLTAVLATSGLLFTACASEDPTGTGGGDSADSTIVIGTANFPESEIIGQLWAEQLTEAGFDVEVTSGIGSREVYLGALNEGSIDLVPEYTGNLAQYLKADIAPGATGQDIYSQLEGALPEQLAVGEAAPAESKDSYVVTKEFAEQHSLKTLEDLKKLDSFTLAGNPELEDRPYGPAGLNSLYGVAEDKVEFTPISDGGGPLTVAALQSGEADVADVYTTSPHLDSEGNPVELVTLEDPKNLISAQNVVPVYREDSVPADAIEALDKETNSLTTADLKAMNERNVGKEKAEPAVIVRDFLRD